MLILITNGFTWHMITDTLYDDEDLQREIRNLFTRTNTLARRFAKCSIDVKIALYKAYCISLELCCWTVAEI